MIAPTAKPRLPKPRTRTITNALRSIEAKNVLPAWRDRTLTVYMRFESADFWALRKRVKEAVKDAVADPLLHFVSFSDGDQPFHFVARWYWSEARP